MNSFAFRSHADASDDRLTILEQKADKSLSKCLFIVAELDMLRDDSYSRTKKRILLRMSSHYF